MKQVRIWVTLLLAALLLSAATAAFAGTFTQLSDLTGFAGHWETADEAIASVTDGILKAKKPGETTLTFRVGQVEKKGARFMEKSLKAGDSVSVRLIVVKKGYAVKRVKLEKSATLTQGETRALTPILTPKRATHRQVFWITDDPAVATVDATGTITAREKGKATVTAIAASGVLARCKVTVQ